jgi:hypothetical protein
VTTNAATPFVRIVAGLQTYLRALDIRSTDSG